MKSILNSNCTVMLATAMAAVSGTVIVLALRLQKSFPATAAAQFSVNHPIPLSLPPRSCISSDEKRREKKKKKKKKKRVHFAEDMVDPTGNSEEFRKKLHRNSKLAATPRSNKVRMRDMPANRMALYNGILRDRVVHRPAYSCSY